MYYLTLHGESITYNEQHFSQEESYIREVTHLAQGQNPVAVRLAV